MELRNIKNIVNNLEILQFDNIKCLLILNFQ
jgi:hypothetical protein